MLSNQQSGETTNNIGKHSFSAMECIETQVQLIVIKSIILFKMVVIMSVSYVWGCSYLLYAIGWFCEKYYALFLFSKIIKSTSHIFEGKIQKFKTQNECLQYNEDCIVSPSFHPFIYSTKAKRWNEGYIECFCCLLLFLLDSREISIFCYKNEIVVKEQIQQKHYICTFHSIPVCLLAWHECIDCSRILFKYIAYPVTSMESLSTHLFSKPNCCDLGNGWIEYRAGLLYISKIIWEIYSNGMVDLLKTTLMSTQVITYGAQQKTKTWFDAK